MLQHSARLAESNGEIVVRTWKGLYLFLDIVFCGSAAVSLLPIRATRRTRGCIVQLFSPLQSAVLTGYHLRPSCPHCLTTRGSTGGLAVGQGFRP